MATRVALGVEADLARGEHAPLDGVDLADQLAIAGQRHVAALEQDLEVRRPALLRLVGEVLADDLREVARQVLGEVHADAAPVDGEPRDGERAEQAPELGLLLGLPLQSGSISDSQIYSRGEQIAPASAVGTAPAPADFPSPSAQAQLTPRTASEWRIKNPDIYGNKLASFHGNDQPERKEYRGVDIFAVFPDAAAQPSTTHDADTLAASRRRVLVPGADTPQSVAVPPREPDLGFRLQILAKWDSPTFIDARDAIPTMVQLTLDWQTESLPVPAQAGSVAPQATTGSTPPNSQRVSFLGNLGGDTRSGGSRTMNLSFGERPVWCPVRHTRGPSAARSPSWRRIACS